MPVAIGGGKTFVANAIIARLRSSGMFVAATAATGVASNLLLRGGTVHKTFKVPVHDLKPGQPCNSRAATARVHLCASCRS